MEIKPQFKPKSIRSFVIRAGRMTEGQRSAFDLHWQRYGLDLEQGSHSLAQAFAEPQPLVMEVGFGMGDSLLQMASAAPKLNFLGVEVHPPGVGRLMNEASQIGLDNLRVYMADANDVLLDCVADTSLHRFQLYFPDPWHKKKHHKRRIVQPEFVSLVARKLQVGGLLHMATDWQPYAESMMELLSAETLLRNTTDGFAVKPEFRPHTKFEARGERLGHGVWDLLFERV